MGIEWSALEESWKNRAVFAESGVPLTGGPCRCVGGNRCRRRTMVAGFAAVASSGATRLSYAGRAKREGWLELRSRVMRYPAAWPANGTPAGVGYAAGRPLRTWDRQPTAGWSGSPTAEGIAPRWAAVRW